MLNYLISIAKDPSQLTTYHIGLAQTKAYRALKRMTNELLEPYGISSVDWALLGLLREQDAGIRSMDLAGLLSVEQPFVTVLLKKLVAAGLVVVENHVDDRRIKLVTLSQKGRDLVPRVEKQLRSGMRPLLSNLSIREILTYSKVIQTIALNGESKAKKTGKK